MSILVHADTKVGKSTLAATCPKPMVFFDVEAAHRFLDPKFRRTFWNPLTEPPPQCDGSWDIAVVIVREYSVLVRGMEWLRSGQHCFRSIALDSISELQKKCQAQLTGTEAMKMQTWGELLRHMEGLVNDMRDLTEHPTNPIEALIITAMTEFRDDKWRPYVQGQLRTILPYKLDVVGYAYVHDIPDPNDPMAEPTQWRRMIVSKNAQFEAGERVRGRLGKVVEQNDLDVERMLDMVFGPIPEAAA